MEPKEEDFDADAFIFGEPTSKQVSRLEKDQLVKCLCELECDVTKLSGRENKLMLVKAVKEALQNAGLLGLTEQEQRQLEKQKERELLERQLAMETEKMKIAQAEREEKAELAKAEREDKERQREHEIKMWEAKMAFEQEMRAEMEEKS